MKKKQCIKATFQIEKEVRGWCIIWGWLVPDKVNKRSSTNLDIQISLCTNVDCSANSVLFGGGVNITSTTIARAWCTRT